MEFFEVKRKMKPRDDDRHEKSTTKEVDHISAQFVAIGVFRSSLLFRLADGVPS